MSLSQLKPKSDSAVVRNMLNEIEVALSSGVSRESIWKAICEEQCLKLSFEGFAKALLRARKSKRVTREAHDESSTSKSSNDTSPSSDRSRESIQTGTVGVDAVSENPSRPNRIRTTRDFERVRKMDFNEFDDKFK
ncbi:hypothetical protein P9281_01570 [Caballeronia sp. LP003]|uniref:hypothetical protein n=1 Tax=Caballeronia sp. LP003 TaxID=3038551 RepID=UPI00285C2463|nr:hypothetical protein [Caballeronia sp. LP003]MDR5785251.1 hypothetical protein [Caballeronia sp. LP003]